MSSPPEVLGPTVIGTLVPRTLSDNSTKYDVGVVHKTKVFPQIVRIVLPTQCQQIAIFEANTK